MKTTNSTRFFTGLVLGALASIGANSALAEVIIYNTGSEATATIALGINDEGHLNTQVDGITANGGLLLPSGGSTGLAYKFPDGAWRDATSPGCLCEGWGVSATIGGGADSGYANVSTDGIVNLTAGPIATDSTGLLDGSFATTTASLTSAPGLTVTQAYSPADIASTVLFKNVVTITNTTGGTIDDVRYVRVMDWDIPFSEFSEAVTIKGTATTTLLEMSHDDGFATANPLDHTTNFGIDAPIEGCAGSLVDFTDCVTTGGGFGGDHGAYFRFNFGTLADGESVSFTIFYGAAGSEIAANAAIIAEGIELFSYGQSDVDGLGGDPVLGLPATYIFGFKGVGGVPVDPTVPEPASLILMGLGLIGLGAVRRRRSF